MRADTKLFLFSLVVMSVNLMAILNCLVFRCIRYNGNTSTTLLADDGFKYQIHLKPKTWMDAHYACNAVESRLAEIYDKKEQIELNYHILKCKAYSDPGKTSGFWLGGKHNGSEWKWFASGRPASRDRRANEWGWHDTLSPSKHNGTLEDCMELRFVNQSDVRLAWHSLKCKEKHPYICQRLHFV